MNLAEWFKQHWRQNFYQLSFPKIKLILAISGGIDSSVMANLFFFADVDFAIAHCNFQLRGPESERDEIFVKKLSGKYNKEIFIKKFETKDYAAQKKLSVQEAARELRYSWFTQLQQGEKFLAVAHTADDNIETSLMFFLRGSGIHGLTGMKEFDKERKLIRPLLFATRAEIALYAKENNLGWVEDSSNSSDKYTRNFLRNTLLPSVKTFFPDVKNNLADNINRFKEVEQLYNYSIQQYKKKLVQNRSNEIHIPVLKLQHVKPLDTIIWEIIKEYNFHPQQIDEVKKLFEADNSSYIQSSTHRIIKNRNWLIIARDKTEESAHILIEENDTEINFKNGRLKITKPSTTNFKLQTANNIAQLDATHITFPLLLRKWKHGDYFYPLGMHKKKKLSRFFIDQKLSATEKEKVWVLESNKKILWVIGYRIDDRFKLSASSKTILSFTFATA